VHKWSNATGPSPAENPWMEYSVVGEMMMMTITIIRRRRRRRRRIQFFILTC
jgi:hypothetical protein